MERWVELEDGGYPDGFPKFIYRHELCEKGATTNEAYPYCPYCGKKITHINTVYKEFNFIFEKEFIVE